MHFRKTNHRFTICVVLLVIFGGCNSSYYGGAPEHSFDVDEDLAQLAEHFSSADSIEDYYNAKKTGANEDELKEVRNRFIAGRLTMMNIRYIQFIRKATSDKQLLDSAAEITVIGLNIAGVSFASAATKTALAGVAAGVSGAKATIDKNYYFEKSIPALIAAMNAQRKKTLIPILRGVKEDIRSYPLEQAVTDLHNYYFAGTFISAIQTIQADAGVKERLQDREIRIAKIGPVTKKDVDLKASLTKAIGGLKAEDLDKVKNALSMLDDPEARTPADFKDAVERLQEHVRKARDPERIKDVANVFRKANIDY